MKIDFIDEYDEVIFSKYLSSVPAVNDIVIINDESYFVKTVIRDVVNDTCSIILSEFLRTEKKENSLIGNNTVTNETRLLQKDITQVLKEVKSLRNEVSSLKSSVKSQNKPQRY